MSRKRTTEGAISSSQGAHCTQEGQGSPAPHAHLVCKISARLSESQETLGTFLYRTFDVFAEIGPCGRVGLDPVPRGAVSAEEFSGQDACAAPVSYRMCMT